MDMDLVQEPAPHRLSLLSIDGGGVRGLSALYILEQVMALVNEKNPDGPELKPYQVFDMIGATSTGDIIAIMLGRLRMDIQDCIDAYISFSDQVFQKEHSWMSWKGQTQGRFSSDALESAIKRVIVQCGFNENELLKDDRENACKVFVNTLRQTHNTLVPLTSYRPRRGGRDLYRSVTIWQACRATSAATTFFDPITVSIGQPGAQYDETFIDAGLGLNNPVRQVWTEAGDIWGPTLDQTLGCLLSIGTGRPQLGDFGPGVMDTSARLLSIATETVVTANSFFNERRHDLVKHHQYFRFDVDRGLSKIGLEEARKRGQIVAATQEYLRLGRTFDEVEECARNLSSRAPHSVIAPISPTPRASNLPRQSRQAAISKHFMVPLDTNFRFVDRPAIIKRLKQYFGCIGVANTVAKRFALTGLGGCGKTELAVRFAEIHRNDYDSIFWVDCTNTATLQQGILLIAKTLGLEDVGDVWKSKSFCQGYLLKHSNWLLIGDNLDHEKPTLVFRQFLTAGMMGHVLVTSRNPQLDVYWNTEEVGDLSMYEGCELLGKIIGENPGMKQDEDTEALINDLGGLALALDQAGSFVKQQRISIAEYRELFTTQRQRLKLLSYDTSRLYRLEKRENVLTTWEISFQNIGEVNQSATYLLLILSLFNTDDISLTLLKAGCNEQSHWGSDGTFQPVPAEHTWILPDLLPVFTSYLDLKQSLALLHSYSFIRWKTGNTVLVLHPLVQEWLYVKAYSDPKLMHRLRICAIGILAGNLKPEDRLPPIIIHPTVWMSKEEKDLNTWPWRRYMQLTSHVVKCLSSALDIPELPESCCRHSLELLQTLEYTQIESYGAKQELRIAIVKKVRGCFNITKRLPHELLFSQKSYLNVLLTVWEVIVASACNESKRQRLERRGTNEHGRQPFSNLGYQLSGLDLYGTCMKSRQACSSAFELLKALNDDRSVEALVRASVIALNYALYLVPRQGSEGQDALPRPAQHPSAQNTDAEAYTAAMDVYYSLVRFEGHAALVRGSEGRLGGFQCDIDLDLRKEITRVAKDLARICGSQSEEYTRAVWEQSTVLMAVGELQSVIPLLQPIIDWPSTGYSRNWLSERCERRLDYCLRQQNPVRASEEVKIANWFQVFVNTLTGKTITVNVCARSLIFEVMKDI